MDKDKMKPRTGRSRVSKADGAARKRADEVLPDTSGRNKVSKAGDISRKIPSQNVSASPSGRSRVSKTDEMARKIGDEKKPAANVPTRRRPESKAEEVSRKVPTNPAPIPAQRVDPEPKIPQPSRAIPIPTPGNKKTGCCLIPFVLGILSAAGFIALVF